MRAFLVIASVFLVVVSARPDIGLKLRQQELLRQQQEGYNYDKPLDPTVSSYNVPTGSVGPNYSNGGNNGNGGDVNTILFKGTGTSSGQNRPRPSVQVVQGEPIIHKHYYVHAAPEEEEAQQQQAQQVVVRPQKHYKIIFVKAPSYPSQSQAQAIAQSKTEEKTLVYVLVKKPEEIAQDQPQGENTFVPEKPEVFFIKYKTQEEAQKAVAEVQEKYNALGGNTQVSQIETTGTIDNGSGHSGHSGTSGVGGGHTQGGHHTQGGQHTQGGHNGGSLGSHNIPEAQYLPSK